MLLGSKGQNKPLGLQNFSSLLVMAGVVATSVITLGELSQQQVTALETGANQTTTQTAWRSASFPVENFQAYTSPFGYRPSPSGGANLEFHRGLDMAAPQGSYIRSWWTGIALEVSDHTGCGTSIIIQSGEWKHVYCHMKGHVENVGGERYLIDREGGIYIKQGQVILGGTRIGRVGMSGRTTGPHLHWGLKYDNNYVDPGQVLRAMYAQQVPSSQISAARGQRVQIKDW